VSTAEIAELRAGVEPIPVTQVPRLAFLRRAALCAYAVGFLVYCVRVGIPVQRELVILWICGALACASIGRSPRQILQLVLDWLPLTAVLLVYDLSRGAADSIGIPVHFEAMIDFDRFLFFGETPTEWMQTHLFETDAVRWWDVFFTIVYTSHFIVPFAVAGVLWARHRQAFLSFTKRFVTLSSAGLLTYIAFPAAPPWMASEQDLLGEVQRSTASGWEVIDLNTAAAFEKGQAAVNLVAAVPSLHAAFAALVAMFLWSRVGRGWRPLLVAYAVAMGFSLVATGEHYVFDILLGWTYAALVMLGWNWWERRRAATTGVRPAAL
jgi:hypothetical protein